MKKQTGATLNAFPGFLHLLLPGRQQQKFSGSLCARRKMNQKLHPESMLASAPDLYYTHYYTELLPDNIFC
jgi:hypothetical protein